MDIDRDRVVTKSNERYYEYLERGELRFQRCDACGYVRHPAREFCPECLNASHEWVLHDGAGRIEALIWYFANVVESGDAGLWGRPDVLPYNAAVVRLDDGGPSLVTTIAEAEFGDVGVGDTVRPVFARMPTGFTSLQFRVATPAELAS
jgi:uncharacterized OB-fold protein